ncbi:mitochondrial carrier [Fomitiporia mediterranea MF3/22]|uniref:mitochondrial carrier n=1 Tax=Fomitiporia mediterranea (strain MF3/22) TaxID=694068 RepID=UPI0004408515|nr:mitochondrial carrier [Fomitiporia mediterranea MF3/22]EJD00884.1 mitochondrial carrier [Fomitiporia mediterranea MF3/22]
MHPLDLLKVKFQTSTSKPQGGIGKAIYISLRDIYASEGIRGLYRGVGANIAGNASSWGLYFLFYNMLKKRMSPTGDPSYKFSSATTLLYAAEASAVTAIMTNPIWVVKVRMFTTRIDNPVAYRSLWHGLSSIYRNEGIKGLYKGTSLALVGVSNGAIQFMGYEQLKWLCTEQKRRRYATAEREWTLEAEKLSNTTYTVISGASKLMALAATYPYQVVRSRIQNNATTHLYPNIPACIARTWREERVTGFYRGLGTNLVRVLPGTCVTFVVYENLAWLLKSSARKREDAKLHS